MIGYREALLELSKNEEMFLGNFGDFLRILLIKISQTADVERVSFWFYDDKDYSLSCYQLYQKSSNTFSSGTLLKRENYPSYFKAIEEHLFINAADAVSHPATSEFEHDYLNQLKITSMLDAQVRYQNDLLGVICMEHTGKIRNWSDQDEYLVMMAANYISIAYTSMQRRKAEENIIRSERYFRLLFEENPSPMWVYDVSSLKFISVNNSAIAEYGYSKEEFMKMTIMDIRSDIEKLKMEERLNDLHFSESTIYYSKHIVKTGQEIDVEIHSNSIVFHGKRGRIVLANNITSRRQVELEKEKLINNLSDYAFFTSHHLRAPVARILGLTDILIRGWSEEGKVGEVIEKVKFSTQELDQVIRELNSRLDSKK